MARLLTSLCRIVLAGLVLAALPLGPIRAGEADFEDADHDDGAPFFGDVKDVNGLKPMDGARVRAEVKGASFPIVVSTDAEGKFKFRGFGKDTPTDDVTITCTHEGYSVVDVSRRKLPGAANAPVEIECLLEKKK